MDRINGAGTVDIGGGRRGFIDEDLGVGQEGTEVTALWLNMTQEEMIKVIETAGLVLNPADWTQLWQALQILGLSAGARSRRWTAVISMTLTSAPGAPTAGDTYLVPTGATGIWATQVGKIAEWNGAAWYYFTPVAGHGISLPDGRVFERIGGVYVEKLALDAQSGKWSYAVAGGTPNALTATLTPAPAALTAGMTFRLKIAATNTSRNVTMNLNGLGVFNVVGGDGTLPKIGDLLMGTVVTFAFDGTNIQIVGSSQVGLRNLLTFTTVGVTNWTVPANVTRVRVTCIGGGGSAGFHSTQPSGGGGSAGRSTKWCDVTPGQVIPVTVGAGGTKLSAVGNGITGGVSSFGSFCSATGGGGGVGGSVAGPGGNTGGGSAGVGVGGDWNEAGAWGGDGISAGILGGAGGGPGNGRGASGYNDGVGASSYGGGGGGGGSSASSGGVGAIGGPGFQGIVIVEY